MGYSHPCVLKGSCFHTEIASSSTLASLNSNVGSLNVCLKDHLLLIRNKCHVFQLF